MAKKKSLDDDITTGSSFFDFVKKIDKQAEIIADSAYSNITDWIPTGSYILNACISGSLFGGIPDSRVTTLFGSTSVGKSFLACSIAREAQKKGWNVFYMDSEGAIDATFVKRLGVDPHKLIIRQVNTISEVSGLLANILKGLEEQQTKNGSCDKVLFVIDSLGNLTSDKEKEDTLSGSQKRDMTKQQEVKALFRVNATPLARTHSALISITHSYASIGSYIQTQVMSSGTGLAYNSSVTLELSAKKLEDKENDSTAAGKAGSSTTTKNGVLITAKPAKSRFTIPRKVSMQIPYFKAPNPYVGLEEFLNWDNAGVCRGNVLTEKEYSKLSQGDQNKCHPFEYAGNQLYALEKDTARGIAVKHLGRQVSFIEFWSDTVFTDEFLHYIDDNVIRPLFELPDQSSFDDLKEMEDILDSSDAEVDNTPDPIEDIISQ